MNLLTKTLNKIFKSGNQQELDKIKPLINEINNRESSVSSLKDNEFKEKTYLLKKNIKEGGFIKTSLNENKNNKYFHNHVKNSSYENYKIGILHLAAGIWKDNKDMRLNKDIKIDIKTLTGKILNKSLRFNN